MESNLFYILGEDLQRTVYVEPTRRIDSNLDILKKSLNDTQKDLLLDILDDKDLIRNYTSNDYYAKGFRKATEIMIESLYIGKDDDM